MKKETLERGNAILKQISDLKDHLENIFPQSQDDRHKCYDPYGFEYSKLPAKERVIPRFRITPFFNDSSFGLKNEFVPFPIDKFMKIYKANVEEKIALLEKEFETL